MVFRPLLMGEQAVGVTLQGPRVNAWASAFESTGAKSDSPLRVERLDEHAPSDRFHLKVGCRRQA